MNLFSVSGLLIGILCFALGVLTMFKGKKSIHYIWAFFSFSVALWGFGSYEIGIARNPESAIFWWRIGYVGVILIPIFFTSFVVNFLELKKKGFTAALYILAIVFLFADFFDGFLIRSVDFLFNQFYYLSSPPILYGIFIFAFFCLIVYSHIKLLQALKASSGIKKSQIKYFLFATIPGFVAGALEFLPVYKIGIYPYLHFIIALSPLTVAYAILKYRLMDIRIVFRKTVVYIFLAGFVFIIFYLITWIYNAIFGGVFNNGAYLSAIIIAPVFVMIFAWLDNKIKGFANKYLFFSLYSHQEIITKLTDELTNSIDLDKIVDSIVNSIKQAMQLDRAGILLIDQGGEVIKYKIAKVIGFNENNGISLVQDNFLTQYLQKTQKPLVSDEIQILAKDLDYLQQKDSFDQLAENMKHIEASLCLPMIISEKLIGIIVLGSKISGDAYTKEDLDLLGTLSKQAAIALDNARLYKEVQDFNKTLQQKVDEQTKGIKEAYEMEKKAHNELKELDESKTQFMLITQHHLRTPLSVNAGFLDFLLAGQFGKIPAKMRKPVMELSDSTKKEIRVVNELLDISSYQLGKEVTHLVPGLDIVALMEETLKDLRIQAEKKGIYLEFKKEGIIPVIPADETKLKVALTNIIDNCVKYTKEGGVTVTIKTEDNKLLILVKDTGMGIAKDAISNLFNQTFHRGAEAQKVFAVGKGIGLFLSGKIIEGHHGKIWAESEGAGKGSAFHIELPAV